MIGQDDGAEVRARTARAPRRHSPSAPIGNAGAADFDLAILPALR